MSARERPCHFIFLFVRLLTGSRQRQTRPPPPRLPTQDEMRTCTNPLPSRSYRLSSSAVVPAQLGLEDRAFLLAGPSTRDMIFIPIPPFRIDRPHYGSDSGIWHRGCKWEPFGTSDRLLIKLFAVPLHPHTVTTMHSDAPRHGVDLYPDSVRDVMRGSGGLSDGQ
jgi:hypothetical protein